MSNIPTADPAFSRRSSLSQLGPRRNPRSRSQSISSDRPSTIMSHGLASPPMAVSPEAAFIAPSAASQIVTNDHDSHADTWYDQHGIETSGETVLVTPSALQLVNDFLDQLLFSFLHLSRSTSLAALRPAVSEVLKPKLAKDVINNADEELREYLGGAHEEDFVPLDTSQPPRDWDPELVWKRTRLRCMVYSSLGDMEEEDEDYYIEQENLEPGVDERGSDLISPAVAIFLTSILEYMGEAALVIAGQAACHRMQAAFEKDLRDGVRTTADVADRIVVEEADMERVALDRTLGRLWRGWKKRIRSPTAETPRSFSRASFSTTHARERSIAGEAQRSATKLPEDGEELATEAKDPKAKSESAAAVGSRVEDYVRASAIPLPVGQRDVDEIEVPGLVSYSDDDDDYEGQVDAADSNKTIAERAIRRPKSMMLFSPRLAVHLPPSPAITQPGRPLSPIPSARKRSVSLPALSQLPYASPLAKRPRFEPRSTEVVEQSASAVESENDEKNLSGHDTKHSPEKSKEPLTAGEMGKKEQQDSPPEIRRRSSKRVSRFVDSATLAGATATAAAAAAAAVANHEPRTSPEKGATTIPAAEVPPKKEAKEATKEEAEELSDSEIEEFDEEPQILTSARISYAGRTSPAISLSSKGSSINVNTNVPMRTPSVHSARVIDVVGPKSPVRSRPSSTEREERPRQVSVYRPPTVEEKPSPPGPASVTRPLADRTTPRSATSLSISTSQDEIAGPAARPSPPTDLAHHAIAELPAQPIYASVVRQPASARHENGPAITATLCNTSNPSARTANTSPTSSPAKSPHQQQQQIHSSGASLRNVSTAKHAHSASIGKVSVERHSPTAESPERTRQVYTSGSSASSGTGRIRAVRTSEDSKRSYRADHVARNFDELIQSDQTIQYTLTPEHMRDMTSASSSHNNAVLPTRSKGVDDSRPAINGDWSRAEANATTRKPSHPVPEIKPTSSAAGGYVPKAPTDSLNNKPKVGGIQARDARVPRESVNDFADFIRSTGPAVDNSPAPVPLVAAEKTAAIKKDTGLRRLASQNKNRPRLQARDAAVDNRGDNSDLIDFIRRGPPGAHNHHIPRHVAPFRSTMDSDQMAGAAGGKAVDATLPDIRNSRASTSVTDTTLTSVQSSINSQSALLRNDRQTGVIEEEGMMPKRTRRRVRDPYAIDFSDEEDDDDLDLAVKPPPKREESLAEFLRNYEPPPEPTPPATPANKPKKKASAPSLMGRFSRSFQGISHANNTGNDAASPVAANAVPRPPHSSNGEARGYTPIQVAMPAANDNSYATSDRLPSAGQMSSSGTRSSGRVLMKKYEPREAVSSASRTNDLATFLRDSEPAPQVVTPITARDKDDEHPSSGSFSKMFSRRKKSTAYS